MPKPAAPPSWPCAELAAAYVASELSTERVKAKGRPAGSGVRVTPYNGKIQDYDVEFYGQVNVIISGLDKMIMQGYSVSAIERHAVSVHSLGRLAGEGMHLPGFVV